MKDKSTTLAGLSKWTDRFEKVTSEYNIIILNRRGLNCYFRFTAEDWGVIHVTAEAKDLLDFIREVRAEAPNFGITFANNFLKIHLTLNILPWPH